MVGGTNKMTDNLKTASEYETQKGEELAIEGSGNERERKDRKNEAPESKRETPPDVRSRSALCGSSRRINGSSSSAASGGESKEEDGEAWQHVPLGRNLRSKTKRGCKTQAGNEKPVKSGHRSNDGRMDVATVKAESEKMDLGELKLGKRRIDKTAEVKMGDEESESRKYLKLSQEKERNRTAKRKGGVGKARKREEKRRALLLNENEDDDDDDNGEDSLEDDRNLEVSLEKELANIRAGLRMLVIGSKGLTKGEASRIFARIERYENVIVRMSVENERLESTMKLQEEMFNTKLAAMDERMNSMEDMMKQVLDKMVKKITEGMAKSIEAKVDVICEKVAGRMNVELSEMKGIQQGSAKSTAVPGKSYALIVKGANEKLTSMEVQKRMFESLSDETGVKIDRVRMLRNGGVVVEAATEEDRRRLAQCPLGDAGLRADAPKRFDPRVIVYDLPSSVTDANLLEELAHKNLDGLVRTEVVKEKVKIVRREKRGNDARVGNVIVELPNEWKEKLLKNGRLYVGWMSYKVRVYEKVLRCHGCMLFDHRVNDCKNGKVCYRCGVVGHQARECRSPEVCVNCKRRGRPADHSAFWSECPEFVWRLNVLRKRVNG
ncbi:uncharacterized protein LOC116418181 [Nasonia vitripennis]|uniref:CCHC-type domain-containing protein n=1 Tax=Nasonia vitripennis TaxID=7425 RepID=A0A7M7QMY9_NASVI|nr:uncharacterized protein LOC103315560 [Nasonia vitripennis]XP_031789143.1 uncharacterized protein LOC116418181 [Nasonia vitripennis]